MTKYFGRMVFIACIAVGFVGCVIQGPRRYHGHHHMPYGQNSYGMYPHPYGEHYNDNKNYSR